MALRVNWTIPEQTVRADGREVVIPAETVNGAYAVVERAEYYHRSKTVVALVRVYRSKGGEPVSKMIEFGVEGEQILLDPEKTAPATVYDWLKANDPRFANAEDV